MNPLPPQAYTKETMLKAYQWLQAQPSNIREMALTPDILVSLFLKASRDGDQSLERPSIQNFKAELKTLAGLMGDLENPATPKPAPIPAPPTPTPSVEAPRFHPTPSSPAPSPAPSATPMALGLDAKSIEMLKDIKEDYNLSCETEALRMLIKIGFTKAKALLKDR